MGRRWIRGHVALLLQAGDSCGTGIFSSQRHETFRGKTWGSTIVVLREAAPKFDDHGDASPGLKSMDVSFF